MFKLEKKGEQRLYKFCKNLIDGVDGDIKTFDVYSEIDRALDFPTNRQILQEKISRLYPKTLEADVGTLKKKYDVQEEKKEHLEKREFVEKEHTAEKEFEKSLKEIEKSKTPNLLEKYFFTIKQFAKMVGTEKATALFVEGSFTSRNK